MNGAEEPDGPEKAGLSHRTWAGLSGQISELPSHAPSFLLAQGPDLPAQPQGSSAPGLLWTPTSPSLEVTGITDPGQGLRMRRHLEQLHEIKGIVLIDTRCRATQLAETFGFPFLAWELCSISLYLA